MCTANCDHTFLWEYSIIYHHLVLKYRTKKLYLCNRPVVWTIVVVKWSACRPSTPTIQCRIPLTPKVFAEIFVLEKNKNEQKETGPFLKKTCHWYPPLKVISDSRILSSFFKKVQSRPLFVYFRSFQAIFYNKAMWKNAKSIQYTAPGFELMTFGTWVVSHNH